MRIQGMNQPKSRWLALGARRGLLIVGMAGGLSRPSAAQLPVAERDSIQAQVQATLDSLTDAWRHVDVDVILRFYLDSALLNGRLVTTGEHQAGWDRVRSGMLRQEIGPFRPIHFDVLNRDVVVMGWINRFTVIDTSGHAQPTMVASNTYVWVRRGGGWRILAAHESRRIAPDSAAVSPRVLSSPRSDELDALQFRLGVLMAATVLTAGAVPHTMTSDRRARHADANDQAQSTTNSPPNLTPVAALASWLAFDAPPGEETPLTNAIMATDGHWRRDDLGNLVMTVGTGHPRRLIACGLDHVGYVVSEITDQGYLRLRRAGSGATHPLWDQFHQAQQIRVLTKNGSVPGVVAVDNAHFAEEHRGDTAVVNVDQLWVDIGVRSRAEATAFGVSLIDPVVRDLPPWLYADDVAGADASGRAGCAAIASIARAAEHDTHRSGETVFLLSVQSRFAWTGLRDALAHFETFDEITIVVGAAVPGRLAASLAERVRTAFSVKLVKSVRASARFAGSLVESVRGNDLDSLLAAVGTAAQVASADVPWVALARPAAARSTRPTDSLSAAADILTRLADLPAVGDHDAPVRDAIRSALPAWVRKQVVQDSTGNLILAMGPNRDTSVFVAHMDEVGYTVRSIDHEGMVTLAPQGGFNGAAWEGQPALLWLDRPSTSGAHEPVAPASLAGVFVPREQATLRRPDVMRAWFGLDSVALAARGVRAGLAVTAYKRGERLAATRFTARALDDRAGDTALLLAIAGMNPATLNHKVIFVWSVEEEIGQKGANMVAYHLGTSVHRAYAIDTFVSSDTPLESPFFAFAPLGRGPVLIAMDNETIVLRGERERIVARARDNHIPLQVGTTRGGSDSGPFVVSGATAAQLGWPGRYSHSPAEVLDLNDVKSLARLVRALAQ